MRLPEGKLLVKEVLLPERRTSDGLLLPRGKATVFYDSCPRYVEVADAPDGSKYHKNEKLYVTGDKSHKVEIYSQDFWIIDDTEVLMVA
jgi:hypothetical protein